jgi:hypothetical protein
MDYKRKIVHQCLGKDVKKTKKNPKCERINEDTGTCSAYPNPDNWWNHWGYCPLATHIRKEKSHSDVKKRVGQQKQRKRLR